MPWGTIYIVILTCMGQVFGGKREDTEMMWLMFLLLLWLLLGGSL